MYQKPYVLKVVAKNAEAVVDKLNEELNTPVYRDCELVGPAQVMMIDVEKIGSSGITYIEQAWMAYITVYKN